MFHLLNYEYGIDWNDSLATFVSLTSIEWAFDGSAVDDGNVDLHFGGHRVGDEVSELTFLQTTFGTAAVDVIGRNANAVVHLKLMRWLRISFWKRKLDNLDMIYQSIACSTSP